MSQMKVRWPALFTERQVNWVDLFLCAFNLSENLGLREMTSILESLDKDVSQFILCYNPNEFKAGVPKPVPGEPISCRVYF